MDEAAAGHGWCRSLISDISVVSGLAPGIRRKLPTYSPKTHSPKNLHLAPHQVQARLEEAAAGHTDGVNFDLEDAAAPGSPLALAYSALVAETADAFHKRDPASQVCSRTSPGLPVCKRGSDVVPV